MLFSLIMDLESSKASQQEVTESASGPVLGDPKLVTTICQLKPFQHGTVIRLQGDPNLRHQLLEMGFTRGTNIEFLRRAPLGDPIDVKLRGYRLSLREAEACAVVVEVKPPNPETDGK